LKLAVKQLSGACIFPCFVDRFRYPSLKNVRELLYKHGHGSVDSRRTPLTSNADIEKVLGMLNDGLLHQSV